MTVRASVKASAGRAKHGFFAHQGFDRFDSLVRGVADEYALTGGQAVRLHDRRSAQRLHIGAGVVPVGECPGLSSRDAVLEEELLGERLRRLNTGGRLGGTEGGDTFYDQTVDEAARQRVFGTDDHEIYAVFLRRPADAIEVGGLHAEVAGDGRGTGIAGGHQEVCEAARLAQFPGDGVLAGAGTDEEDVHGREAERGRRVIREEYTGDNRRLPNAGAALCAKCEGGSRLTGSASR